MASLLCCRIAAAFLTASWPFRSSSPTLSRPTDGCCKPSTLRANTSPMTANCTRLSAPQLTLAPRSSITVWPRMRREHRGDRRPIDARQRLEDELRHRHQRAGVAGRDDAVGVACRHRVDGHAACSTGDRRAAPSTAVRWTRRRRWHAGSRRDGAGGGSALTSGTTSSERPNSRKRTFLRLSIARFMPSITMCGRDRRPSHRWRWSAAGTNGFAHAAVARPAGRRVRYERPEAVIGRVGPHRGCRQH